MARRAIGVTEIRSKYRCFQTSQIMLWNNRVQYDSGTAQPAVVVPSSRSEDGRHGDDDVSEVDRCVGVVVQLYLFPLLRRSRNLDVVLCYTSVTFDLTRCLAKVSLKNTERKNRISVCARALMCCYHTVTLLR